MSAQSRSARLNRSYLSRVAGPAFAEKPDAADIPMNRTPARPTPAAAPARPERPRIEGNASVLEARHPDMVKAISLLWGFPEMNEYFDRLWLADGNHGPLDPDAMSELMLLSRVHQVVVPKRPARSLASIYGSDRMYEPQGPVRDPWSDVPPRR
jgi:hypothetical protein